MLRAHVYFDLVNGVDFYGNRHDEICTAIDETCEDSAIDCFALDDVCAGLEPGGLVLSETVAQFEDDWAQCLNGLQFQDQAIGPCAAMLGL